MPVSYSFEVSNSRVFGMSRLFLKWRGGIFKVILTDFLVYMVLFAALRVAYINSTGETKIWFEGICGMLKENMTMIPVAFLLGFFVSQVYARWWAIFQSIPWPYSLVDMLALTVSARGAPDTDTPEAASAARLDVRLINQTIVRYAHLTLAMVLRNICSQFQNLMVKKDITFVEMGLAGPFEMKALYTYSELLPHERAKLGWTSEADSNKKVTCWNFWLPMVWGSRLVRYAFDKGYIDSRENLRDLYQKLHTYKGLCGGLTCYDWICIPLPYTQVVSIGVYSYFFFALFAYQEISEVTPSNHRDYLVPMSLFLQFFITYGWMKVAESLLNPMGDDVDYNFDMVAIFALHLETSREHLEVSEEFGQFLERCPDNVRNLARLPREDLFVKELKSGGGGPMGSLFKTVLAVPEVLLDSTKPFFKLPATVWRNSGGIKEMTQFFQPAADTKTSIV